MPELASTAFSIRIGSRTPLVLFAEHVAIPTEAERARGPFAFFKPVPNQLSALYVVGVEASAAYCGKTPKVRVAPKGLKVRGLAWTPGRGCEPPGAHITKERLSRNLKLRARAGAISSDHNHVVSSWVTLCEARASLRRRRG